MSAVNFASAEMEVVIHATEDTAKVLKAIKSILPIEPEEFVADSIKGHFGNEIILLKAILSGKKASDIAHKIIGMMSDEDRLSMYNNFDLFTDEKFIYLRISKQNIFEHKIVLEQTDSVKIKFKTIRGFQSKNGLEGYRRMLAKGDID
jgi:RNA binding exosome subunit